MAVTDVKPLYSECTRASIDGVREYTSYFQVETNSANDGPITVRDATGIPVASAAYVFGSDSDLGAFANSYTATLVSNNTDHLRLWRVAVGYTTEANNRSVNTYLDDPVDEPAIISGSFVDGREPVTTDKDGNAVANSAGDAFDDLEKERDSITLVVQKNFDQWNLTLHNEYRNTVNSTTFFGQGKREWLLKNIRAQQLFWGTSKTPYYQIVFEFLLNENKWDFKPADRGWFYRTTGGDKKIFRDSEGLPLNALGLLDGSGGQLASTASIVYFDSTSGATAAFRVYPEKNFVNLGIPTNSTSIV